MAQHLNNITEVKKKKKEKKTYIKEKYIKQIR
jgi:hypothetical protein